VSATLQQVLQHSGHITTNPFSTKVFAQLKRAAPIRPVIMCTTAVMKSASNRGNTVIIAAATGTVLHVAH